MMSLDLGSFEPKPTHRVPITVIYANGDRLTFTYPVVVDTVNQYLHNANEIAIKKAIAELRHEAKFSPGMRIEIGNVSTY